MGDPDAECGFGGNGWVAQDVAVRAPPEEAALSMGEVVGIDLFGTIANCTGGGGPACGSGGMGT